MAETPTSWLRQADKQIHLADKGSGDDRLTMFRGGCPRHQPWEEADALEAIHWAVQADVPIRGFHYREEATSACGVPTAPGEPHVFVREGDAHSRWRACHQWVGVHRQAHRFSGGSLTDLQEAIPLFEGE